jgi:hypothetical protein
MSGYVFTLGGDVVSWMSCKYTILMRSTIQVELAALDIINGDSQSRQFKGQYEVIKTHQKIIIVCQKNEKL